MSPAPPPVTHLADRTVAVSGALQGSGVLLTDRLVLTCAHVVKTGSVLIAHPALPGRIRATVTWIDYHLDAALLEATQPVPAVPPVRLGVLDTREAIPGCEITGFPRVQRYGGGLRKRLEVDQYTVTVLPMAGRVRDLLVCDLDGPPAAGRDDEPPALSGLSGGPLFAGDILLGIARQVPRQREGRRVECVPLGPVLAAEPFGQAYRRTGALLREERVHGNFPRDLRYEAEYAQALGVAYRRTKIFGLDELSRHDSEWDLDTAYLSLEAQAQAQDRSAPAPPLPQRIDTLLTDRPRVLLRGEAGAGKTTLLWWLAAHASARTLDDDLAPLNGLVPFVVPLRTLRARGGGFPGPAQLAGAAGLVVDAAPEGWVGRVLESGRALLLVDGLDEVPPEDREQAHDWLSQLLRRYPQTRCMATVRPLAVEPDWLRSEGFAELRLLPMRNEDIQAFVASWHRAARLSEEDDADRLDELERDLALQFDQNPTLRDLARTPLLCAVICALHRRRDGFLPETRWSLYRSALEMLLGHRDRRRRIGDPEGIDLSVEEHTQLLQRIAVWLVREGQSEFTREQALRQLGRALTGMERVSAQGPPGRILTHLLNRSGLLQERTDDTYQFIHRTFQDYLAAKEFVEDDHLNELLHHADDAAWQDTILLASGHCSRRQLPVLVHGLLDAARVHDDGSDERAARHVRATLCAQHATWLESEVSERVRDGMASLFPLRSDSQVRSLALLGTAALPYLPAPESCERNSNQAKLMVSLLGRVGGTETLAYARAWALIHPGLAREFQYCWSRFPEEAYAREVLAHTDLDSHYLTMQGREQALALRLLPSARDIVMGPGITDADLRTATDGKRLRSLVLRANDLLTNLTPLGQWADCLTYLQIQQCPSIQNLAPLAELTALTALELDVANLGSLDSLTAIQDLPSLDYLGLDEVDVVRFSDLPPHSGVSTLSLECMGSFSFDGLEAWESLTTLSLLPYSGIDTVLAGLAKAPQVTVLEAYAFPWEEADRLMPVPSLLALSLNAPPRNSRDLLRLRRLFPALMELELHVQPTQTELDLAPLAQWAGLQVTIDGLAREKLLGADQLADRLHTR
ncbi:NACHT domain-containing protein [Streptomyces cyaneofuscatus]|uniref:NACHT domain-containing protein n=1 Tax=Streptomyces cyaneofuscatus TaxID=66883 RepID=UPI002D783B25|nr:NACHT domain-containing protein [Streptomyces cyaneofuscatus]WRO10916.1 NACHT domain-containing protein [Streptomyces cyaneofuscatus]